MIGIPIVSVVCHCDDCQTGFLQLETLPGATPILDAACGTPCVLYRNDRVTCTKGAELLEGRKIRERSATSRLVATCCNSAMLMRLDDIRHWTPVYRDRFVGDALALEMRINTQFKPEGIALPADMASHPSIPLRFIARLISARIAMTLAYSAASSPSPCLRPMSTAGCSG
ncbi:hypothetical protein [Devosia sp.]|uniref:hypothetical protein n=1 Tax=Devosia sp. TaxID=1871048 RepID=UPI002604D0FE|nr:hypothetical protein [Devosia sp.]